MGLCRVLQAIGFVSWGLAVFLVGATILIAWVLLIAPILAGLLVAFDPLVRWYQQLAAISYLAVSVVLSSALYAIFTRDSVGMLMRNTAGPRLSMAYMLVPLILFTVAVLLLCNRSAPPVHDY